MPDGSFQKTDSLSDSSKPSGNDTGLPSAEAAGPVRESMTAAERPVPTRPREADATAAGLEWSPDAEDLHVVSESNFPTPELAKKTNSPADWEKMGGFASLQKDEVNRGLPVLSDQLDSATTREERAETFAADLTATIQWRLDVAVAQGGKPEASKFTIGKTAESFDADIDDDMTGPFGPNFDRIGEVGRLRVSATWDENQKTLVGGEDTPASQTMREAGIRANERMDREVPGQDVLHNQFELSDGSTVNGSLLLRGEAASAAGEVLRERQVVKGRNTDRFDVGGNSQYIQSGTVADRAQLRKESCLLLADLEGERAAGGLDFADSRVQDTFSDAMRTGYQGLRKKGGSDAVQRTHMMKAYVRLSGTGTAFPHDVDLMANILSQDDFREYMRPAYTARADR